MTTESAAPETNPLLDPSGLPRYDKICPEHVEPGMRALLAELERDLDALESDAPASWGGLVEPLERIGERLSRSWGAVGHLMGVANSDALREAHAQVQPEVVRFSLRLVQSLPVFRGLTALRESDDWELLDPDRRRGVEILLRDAKLSGVGLEGAQRERFNRIQIELAELGTRFSNHVLDATKAFSLLLRDPAEVAGLPASWRELAAQSARAAGEEEATAERGPWLATLDSPSYLPVLQHAQWRELRETVYRAQIGRASDGELDNAPLIERILELRREEARLLGFASYAELSLASKMAPDVAAVRALLEELRGVSLAAARSEHEQLEAFAHECGQEEPLRHWDVFFWAERLRERRYAYTDEELRPYFPLPRVLEGLFGLAERLFDVRIRAADGQAPVWHPDVRFFRVFDAADAPLAAFYLDPMEWTPPPGGIKWVKVVLCSIP